MTDQRKLHWAGGGSLLKNKEQGWDSKADMILAFDKLENVLNTNFKQKVQFLHFWQIRLFFFFSFQELFESMPETTNNH